MKWSEDGKIPPQCNKKEKGAARGEMGKSLYGRLGRDAFGLLGNESGLAGDRGKR